MRAFAQATRDRVQRSLPLHLVRRCGVSMDDGHAGEPGYITARSLRRCGTNWREEDLRLLIIS